MKTLAVVAMCGLAAPVGAQVIHGHPQKAAYGFVGVPAR